MRPEARANRINTAAGRGLVEHFLDRPLQRRIATTTIVVIEFH
jgi:hypothetical protein